MDYLISLNNISIKSCKCYESYWKNVIKSKHSVIHFDASIEKVFSYRKYFVDGKMIYHICKNCLNEVIRTIPLRTMEFETTTKERLNCIFKLRNNTMLIEGCCYGCINFVICNFSSCVLINI